MEDKKQKNQSGLLASMARFTPREFRRITRQMYEQNLELVQLNKILSLLNSIDLIVLQPHDGIRDVASKITDTMVEEYGAYAFAAIFCKLQDTSQNETLQSWGCNWIPGADQTFVRRFIEGANINGGYDWRNAKNVFFGSNGNEVGAILQQKPQAVKQFCEQMHIERIYVAKLMGGRGVIGTLFVGMHENATHEEELLTRVSEAISMALDNQLLQEENARILERLKRSNAKLRKLDETKDDFISMASHQLRTPLTSVKGYVSMVLDGDAGKITHLQRRLLTQSFVSSQRMVYLISDLLNVSRLKTGKFVIEPVYCNLAKVIQEEVGQLMETAKGRHLELTYEKPAHFPVLLMDETKIRQVIMNFLDNAVYYTPAGGRIEVHLVDKPQTIEFTVADNGIGVPRHEQLHLFTKFYRAPNAKRARPDGTGLGLFMAKKVVIAQGGAVIFKSQEGKGSTFGFTFAKAPLIPGAHHAEMS
jgi:signal transduction histidine kinase